MQRFPEAPALIFPAPEIPPAAVLHREPAAAPDPAAAAEKHKAGCARRNQKLETGNKT